MSFLCLCRPVFRRPKRKKAPGAVESSRRLCLVIRCGVVLAERRCPDHLNNGVFADPAWELAGSVPATE
ncbi:hypothetical protein SF06_24540 [Pseudomonas flexibilis]|nr:hypothetical protein SF06_24540 [Pseudomonas flexibilis]